MESNFKFFRHYFLLHFLNYFAHIYYIPEESRSFQNPNTIWDSALYDIS